MKKLAIFALVLGLAVAFAVPAFAFKIEGAKDQKFYFGGTIMTDVGYWVQSKEMTAKYGETGDRSSFFLNIPRHSNVQASFESGNTGGFFQLRYGRDFAAAHDQADTANYSPAASGISDKTDRKNYIEAAKMYGWYTFGNCMITAGKLDGQIFSVIPYQNLGLETANHIYGFGWGAYYDDRAAQIRWNQNVSKAFGYQISLVQPYYTDFNDAAGKNYDSYAQIPMVAVKLTMNFGPVSLFPAASYMQLKWQDIPNGYDDNLVVWNALLPVRVMAGPFIGTFQIGYGQNMGLGGYHTLQNPLATAYRNATGQVLNSKSWSGFVDLAFNAGTITPHIYFGYDQVTNSDVWKVGDDNNVRMMYGASAKISLSQNFAIIPEITFYDYGKVPGNAAKPDIGKEWLAGAQFQFAF